MANSEVGGEVGKTLLHGFELWIANLAAEHRNIVHEMLFRHKRGWSPSSLSSDWCPPSCCIMFSISNVDSNLLSWEHTRLARSRRPKTEAGRHLGNLTRRNIIQQFFVSCGRRDLGGNLRRWIEGGTDENETSSLLDTHQQPMERNVEDVSDFTDHESTWLNCSLTGLLLVYPQWVFLKRGRRKLDALVVSFSGIHGRLLAWDDLSKGRFTRSLIESRIRHWVCCFGLYWSSAVLWWWWSCCGFLMGQPENNPDFGLGFGRQKTLYLICSEMRVRQQAF